MFANFLYFIVALLIYVTYQPPENPNFTFIETLLLFFSLILLFTILSRVQFRRLEMSILNDGFSRTDHRFNALLNQQSILAMVVYALDLYGLSLPSHFNHIRVFNVIPTIEALLFVAVFIFYLSIVWANAHSVYRKIYRSDLTRASYVFSNVSFAVPVLMPWVLLSGVIDIINGLPFDGPKQFLATPLGEISYFLSFLIIVSVFGPLLIQKFWRCRPLEHGIDRSRIEHLCKKAGLKYANILYWPIFGGKMITAGVMGLFYRYRYILVTDALLRLLEPDEIDAVIAHEIGHVKKKHLLFYLFFFIGYIVFTYSTSNFILYFIIFTDPIYRLISSTGISQPTLSTGILSVIIILNFLIYFRFVFGYFMRNFERQADVYVYSLFDSAQALISTFKKITYYSRQRADRPNWHHFSIKQRVDYLEKCEKNKSWIFRQDQKIRRSIAVYLMGILIIGTIGYQINFGKIGNILNEKRISKQIEKHPDNATLYWILGEIHLNQNNYQGAMQSWSKSLDLKSDNPTLLNNLAWLYATCEIRDLRDYDKALILAEKAIQLDPSSPYILDTYAESLFVNGRIREAILVEERALELASKDRKIYEQQLDKFKNALEQQ